MKRPFSSSPFLFTHFFKSTTTTQSPQRGRGPGGEQAVDAGTVAAKGKSSCVCFVFACSPRPVHDEIEGAPPPPTLHHDKRQRYRHAWKRSGWTCLLRVCPRPLRQGLSLLIYCIHHTHSINPQPYITNTHRHLCIGICKTNGTLGQKCVPTRLDERRHPAMCRSSYIGDAF